MSVGVSRCSWVIIFLFTSAALIAFIEGVLAVNVRVHSVRNVENARHFAASSAFLRLESIQVIHF